VLALIVLVAPARATMVERMALDRIARDAARIVQATVVEVHSGRDESGMPATWITLAVGRALKGAAAKTITIKQYGTSEPLPDGTLTRVAGLPRYAVGDEVVLFLHAESRRGFTSPVGFGQGAWRVDRRRGRPVVADDAGGRRRDLDEFLATVGRLAGAPR